MEKHILILYIAGKTEKARRAIDINRYYREHFPDVYFLKRIDIKEHLSLL
jgi:hypothetical protein